MADAAWRRRFRAPRTTLPRWGVDAPDRLLYASNHTGTWELFAWDRAADTHRQVTDRREGTTEGAIERDGRHIWWFDDTDGDEFGRWMVEPFEGGEARVAHPVLPRAYNAGIELGHGLAVIGSSDDAGTRIHVLREGGDPVLLYQHAQAAWTGGLSRDGELLCIQHSEHGDARHPALRLVTLDGDLVGDLWDGPGRGLEVAGWSPVAGDARLLVHHERDGQHRPLIWEAGGREVQLDVDLPGEVSASWYPDASALLLVHDYRGRSELYRIGIADQRLERLRSKPGSAAPAAVRPDGEVWYLWSDATTPPEVRSTSGATVMRAPGEPAPPGVAYRDLDVGAVHAFVAEPDGARPHPTIFLIHGGPESHDRDAWFPPAQAWIDHGLAVVMVNYRGSSGYGSAWRDALEGNPGLTELEDIAAVRDRVVADGIADPRRLVLAGGSWGGYLTLLGLGTQPELWALGLAAVPVADYIAAYEDEMEPLKHYDRSIFGASPDEDPERYRVRSPITYVERLRAPVFILAGENDPRCPIRQIDNYVARLAELVRPHEVLRYDAGHGSMRTEERIRQLEAQIEFTARALGTRAPD